MYSPVSPLLPSMSSLCCAGCVTALPSVETWCFSPIKYKIINFFILNKVSDDAVWKSTHPSYYWCIACIFFLKKSVFLWQRLHLFSKSIKNASVIHGVALGSFTMRNIDAWTLSCCCCKYSSVCWIRGWNLVQYNINNNVTQSLQQIIYRILD